MAVQKFHGDVSSAIFLPNVVNRADVGMIECRSGLRFSLKAAQGLRVLGDVVGQEFQGDVAVQPGVLGFIHHTHATYAESFKDVEVRNGLSDERFQVRHCGVMLGCQKD